MRLKVGLDVGSTTAKLVALNDERKIVFKKYLRHFSDVKNTTVKLLNTLMEKFPNTSISMNVSGSSGLNLSEQLNIPFIQEVVACTEAVKSKHPNIDAVIELGGEDAKIIYLTNGMEQRMNAACAGGTGAFIDQIASLLNTDASGLNELARGASKIYPIASRCGVFAKTDIQPLLNEGVDREDIAASVFQAVVNQTVGGLASGRPIRGNVALLGGPLTFLPELRKRFIETLKLNGEEMQETEDGQYYVAIGAALESSKTNLVSIDQVVHILDNVKQQTRTETTGLLDPFFKDEEEFEAFNTRHNQASVDNKSLSTYEGNCYIGIDAGSTTTKLLAMGEDNEILFSFYENNKGDPIKSVQDALELFYSYKNDKTIVANSAVTGYGEKLIQAAFKVDEGEIETIAHYKAAKHFQPNVDFIIDIGGQDMKCIKIKNGVIDQILLNEACSAGCGSFIASFADTLNLSVEEFVQASLSAKYPVDLGSRCTVFMNSKVKQIQKEGAEVADIAAGIAYSVVANALYKVIKLKDVEDLGENIVVQGGTFLNDAVLRAFEKEIGVDVVRPQIAGLMGAYGSALVAQERSKENQESTLLAGEKLREFSVKTSHSRCRICENNCALTINKFKDKRIFITGNRCERGAGKPLDKNRLPNLMKEKMERLFDRESLPKSEARRGKIGIPRVLNMYENYPFWHRFFTELKYEVVLSDRSNKKDYEQGMETIPSESVCYPAKVSHGHIFNLMDKGVKTIFYPSIVFERLEHESQDNHFNCPVVASYPEVLKTNIQDLKVNGVEILNPFMSLDNLKSAAKELKATFPDLSMKEIQHALKQAVEEDRNFKAWTRKRGEEILNDVRQSGRKALVVGAHPYHLDPAIHHGISDEINRLGFAVLTEDSICHLDGKETPVNTVNQWTYHSRLYRAAEVTIMHPELEFLHITSFGCGIDAITGDTVQEILEQENEIYTWIKMDEISNLGAARIRLRSLQAALREREEHGFDKNDKEGKKELVSTPTFEKEHKKTHTILSPQLVPTHFKILEPIFRQAGYKIKVIEKVTEDHTREGLRYVNNDACHPAIMTIGQLIGELKTGNYDLDTTAIIMSQTGGGCRATNYIALLKKALQSAGMKQVPVISLNAGNAGGLEEQPGFSIDIPLVRKLVIGACVGDLLDRLRVAVRPYEKVKGTTEAVYEKYREKSIEVILDFSMREYKKFIKETVAAFDQIEVEDVKKPRVGIVGEILIKFHPDANNQLIEIIENEGGEAVVPDFVDFFLYGLYNNRFKADHLGKSKWNILKGEIGIRFIEHYRNPIREELLKTNRFEAPHNIEYVAEKASKVLSLGNQMGEGWLLPGEMVNLIESNAPNIVCIQPFGCLPNHVIGKGMFNGIKDLYPQANLLSIDYDSGSSQVNQLNRIKLMINIANAQEIQV